MSEAESRAKFKYYKLSKPEKAKVIDVLRERLVQEEDIVFAYLYGSFLERGMFKDVDVAVWVRGKIDPIYYAVDFSVKVGAGLGVPIDTHALNDAPLPIKYRVLAKGKPIFCRDEKLRVKLIDETIRQYLDLKLLRSNK